MSYLSANARIILRQFLRNIHVARRLIWGTTGDSHLDVTLTANTTLTKRLHFSHRIVRHDPGGGARVLTLPAEADMDGYGGLLVNAADAAETLTVNNDTDLTEIAEITQDEASLLFCDGTNWWGIILAPSGIT